MSFIFIIYLIFGILPSLTWLFYYLRKDLHPESKKMIVKIFLVGAVATIPTLFIELSLTSLLTQLQVPFVYWQIIRWFLIIALTEEMFKYLVVRFFVLKNPEFDEPVDAMIYMVISSLGFAAAENVLYLTIPVSTQTASLYIPFSYILTSTIFISIVRFLGANFLHTLCSATIGYFLALSIIDKKNKSRLMVLGFFVAVSLHGSFNFFIMAMNQGWLKITACVTILIILTFFVMREFKKLQKIKSF